MRLDKNRIYQIFLVLIMLFGILLRIKTFLIGRPLWHDECALALNVIGKSFLGFFAGLDNSQFAPPLFMLVSKIFTNIFGGGEYVLRILPFLCGILSIPLFYLFSKRFFTKKWSIILANFLFAINYYLIYYAQEFKQYSVDVFSFILIFLIFFSLDFSKLNNKKVFGLGLIMGLLPLISTTSVFVIMGFSFYKLLKDKLLILKKLILFLCPFLLILGSYYFIVLHPQMNSEINYLQDYWQKGFLSFNLASVLLIIKSNLLYYFSPNKFILFELILLVCGFVQIIKKRNVESNGILLSVFILILLASMMHIYPIFERVSLYLIPLLIIVMLYPIDKISVERKIYSPIIVILFLLSFCAYNPAYCNQFFSSNIFQRINGKEIMKVLSEKYKSDDVVIISTASYIDYQYYSRYYGFNAEKWGGMNLPEYNESLYYQILDALPSGKYWFYCGYDFSHSPIIQFVQNWAKTKAVIYENNDSGAYLLYLRK